MVKRTNTPPAAVLPAMRSVVPPAVQRKARALPPVVAPMAPSAGTVWQRLAPHRAVIQKMEAPTLAQAAPQVSYKMLTERDELYHSTGITKAKAKDIVNKQDTLRTPAYFKDVAYNSYGGRLIVFKIRAPLQVVDFSVPGCAEAFYSELVQASQFDAAEALVHKAKGKVANGKWVVKPAAIFMTRSDLDKSLEAGLAALGKAGWLMPFNGFNEIMLLNLSNVEASSWS